MATSKKQVTKTSVKKAEVRTTSAPQKLMNTANSHYAVEKGVPLTSFRASYNGHEFPLDQMNVGDSFLIPVTDRVCKNPNTLHYAAKMFARMKPGFTLTTRLQLDKARRVWRIK